MNYELEIGMLWIPAYAGMTTVTHFPNKEHHSVHQSGG